MASGPAYPMRLAYVTIAFLAVAGILFQVFLVGLSLLGGQQSWGLHVEIGHFFGLLPLLLVGIAFIGRFPPADRRLNLLFLGIFILQAEVFAGIRNVAPLVAALHPVLALVMFATSALIAQRAYALLRVQSPTRSETSARFGGKTGSTPDSSAASTAPVVDHPSQDSGPTHSP